MNKSWDDDIDEVEQPDSDRTAAPEAKIEVKIDQCDFETAMQQLQSIVRQLESGSLSLAGTLERYQHGIGFLARCQQLLSGAEKKLQQLSGFDADGNPIVEAMEDSGDDSLEAKAENRSRRRSARPSSTKRRRKAQAGDDSSESAEESENQDPNEKSESRHAGRSSKREAGEDDMDFMGELF